MKIQLNKQVILSVETVCSLAGCISFENKLIHAMVLEELTILRLHARAKSNCKKQAILKISYTQCQCLVLMCNAVANCQGAPQIVKEYVINPILKSLLEPQNAQP